MEKKRKEVEKEKKFEAFYFLKREPKAVRGRGGWSVPLHNAELLVIARKTSLSLDRVALLFAARLFLY